jgi:hypothetical protein
MSRFTPLFYVLPFAAGILTGCTTLVTSLNRIHAAMTKEETPGESHNYGAFFKSSLSWTSELPTEWSGAKQLSDRPEHDLSDADLIRRVNENATDFRNPAVDRAIPGIGQESVQPASKPKKQNSAQSSVPEPQSAKPVDP